MTSLLPTSVSWHIKHKIKSQCVIYVYYYLLLSIIVTRSNSSWSLYISVDTPSNPMWQSYKTWLTKSSFTNSSTSVTFVWNQISFTDINFFLTDRDDRRRVAVLGISITASLLLSVLRLSFSAVTSFRGQYFTHSLTLLTKYLVA